MSSPHKSYSLYELCQSIQRGIETRYTGQYWVRAEMNQLNHYKQTGNCYPDLLERDGEKVVAQLRAVLWKTDYQRINRRFEDMLGEPLKDGIKILIKARVNFDTVRGISLHITDIDPQFTLGDLEREKQETLKRLEQEGIIGQNKSLHLPLLPMRLAVISVETSKGYADFMGKLEDTARKYQFFHMLFPSLLQGEHAIKDLLRALGKIKRVRRYFDAVIIVRGGGGEIGLSVYNNYTLAKAIAGFPLPVLTGIGHRANNTVAEQVAHTSAITPTDIAYFLIKKCADFENNLSLVAKVVSANAHAQLSENMQQLTRISLRLQSKTLEHMREAALHIHRFSGYIANESPSLINQNLASINGFPQKIKREAHQLLKIQHGYLGERKKNIDHLHPDRVLKRGYSITRINGMAITEVTDLQKGDTLATTLAGGILESTIDKIRKKKRDEN
jgi:exodeoxyribonuclease VII large subunit